MTNKVRLCILVVNIAAKGIICALLCQQDRVLSFKSGYVVWVAKQRLFHKAVEAIAA